MSLLNAVSSDIIDITKLSEVSKRHFMSDEMQRRTNITKLDGKSLANLLRRILRSSDSAEAKKYDLVSDIFWRISSVFIGATAEWYLSWWKANVMKLDGKSSWNSCSGFYVYFDTGEAKLVWWVPCFVIIFQLFNLSFPVERDCRPTFWAATNAMIETCYFEAVQGRLSRSLPGGRTRSEFFLGDLAVASWDFRQVTNSDSVSAPFKLSIFLFLCAS